MGRYAYEQIIANSASVHSSKQKLCRIPSKLPNGSVPGIDGPLITKCCTDFLDIFLLFCCEFSGLLLSAVSFVNWKIAGLGKESLEEEDSKSGSRLQIFKLWNVWSVCCGPMCI